MVHLTILPHNSDNAAHHPVQSVIGTGQDEPSAKPSERAVKPSGTDENGANWGSTAYATTRLAINLVKESADVFPLLKSVAGGLSAILLHCDVRFTSRTTPLMALTTVVANNCVSQNDRIVEAPSRKASGIAEWTRYQR